MGCGLHLFVEKKINSNWRVIDSPRALCHKYEWNIGCNYGLFDVLAGVRGCGTKVTRISNEPRGWPEDISQSIKDEDDTDLHSHSYVTLEEALIFAYGDDWINNKFNKFCFIDVTFALLIDQLVRSELTTPGMLPNDIRFVFAFDN